MYKVIKVDGKDIPMEANATTCIRYRLLFHKNLDDLWTGENPNKSESCAELAYIMAMSATGADMNKLSYDSFLEWGASFSGLAFLNAFSDIYDLYAGDAETEVEAKKNNDQQNAE